MQEADSSDLSTLLLELQAPAQQLSTICQKTLFFKELISWIACVCFCKQQALQALLRFPQLGFSLSS